MAIGGIISAGLGLVSSLFGKKKQKTETTVNYQQMVESATAAGFNPLTAIRNGGSAGFTTTTSPTVSQIPDALANFGGVLGSALEKRLDPIEAKKREIDTLMTDVQLKEARALSKRPGSFYQPVEWSGTQVSSQFVPRLGAKSHKQSASVASFVPSAKPGTSWFSPPSSAAKEPLRMWVEGVDRDGKRTWVVNPDGPDFDQWIVPYFARAMGGLESAADSAIHARERTTVRKASEAQRKANENSWHRGWLPSVSINGW